MASDIDCQLLEPEKQTAIIVATVQIVASKGHSVPLGDVPEFAKSVVIALCEGLQQGVENAYKMTKDE